jgi:putative ABC transport system permease protein
MLVLRNLLRNKTRTLLTTLSVAIGISIFVSLISISSGFKGQIQDLIRSYHVDLTVQAREAATPLSSRISAADYARLKGLRNVEDVSSVVMGYIRAPWNPYFLVVGVSSAEQLSSRVGLVSGRLFVPGKGELLLGETLAKAQQYAVGNRIILTDREVFTIAGIHTVGSRLFDASIVLETGEAQRLLKRDDSVNLALIRLRPGVSPDAMVRTIGTELPGLMAIRTGDFAGDVKVFSTIDTFAAAVSAISLLACCAVVMNTLLMAITERTREIGILMAVGWSRGMIVRTVLAEAVLICIGAAVAGNFLSLLTLWAFNRINFIGVGWIPVAVSPEIALRALGLAIFLAVLSALYPAFVATRHRPAEALRHE